MLDAIEKAKAKDRMLVGKKSDTDPGADLPQGQKGRVNDIVAGKLNMGMTNYKRAKYIVENAPPEMIAELDAGQRTIHNAYCELRSRAKDTDSSALEEVLESVVQEDFHDTVGDDHDSSSHDHHPEAPTKTTPKPAENSDKAKPSAPASTSKPSVSKPSASKPSSSKPPSQEKINSLFSKADLEAMKRNEEFAAMSDAEKVEELQRRLKEALKRAAIAESELSRLKELRHNDNYHKDGNIRNLQARLDMAEARVAELEALHGSGSKGE